MAWYNKRIVYFLALWILLSVGLSAWFIHVDAFHDDNGHGKNIGIAVGISAAIIVLWMVLRWFNYMRKTDPVYSGARSLFYREPKCC